MFLAVTWPVPCSTDTIRVACLNGLKHDYDLPNGLAAKVAAARINNDSAILPNDHLELLLLDTTLVRTARSLSGVRDDEFEAIRVAFFDATLSAAEGTIASSCNQFSIAAVVGPLYSSESKLLKTVLKNDHRDLMTLSYGATSPSLSNMTEYPNFGRTIPSDFLQGNGIADLIKHLAIPAVKLWGCNDVYCQGLVDVFRQRANFHGIEIDNTHADFNFVLGYGDLKDNVRMLARDCTVPRVNVLMVQRANAEAIFRAAKELGALGSFIFVGPVSVSGLATLPAGYLGFKTGVDKTADEYAKLQSRWNEELGDSNHPIIQGAARDVSTHPYVGFAYDAVLTIAKALHSMRLNGEDIYNQSLFRQRIRNVSFAGASGNILLDDMLEPAQGRYLILNKKSSGEAPYIGTWSAGVISHLDAPAGQTQAQWESNAIEWPSSDGKSPGVECTSACPPGAFWSREFGACQECPAGTFEADRMCEACAVGKHTPIAGLTTCLPCMSGYANRTGQVECTRCPAYSETDMGTEGTSPEECICNLNMYRLTPGAPCMHCEAGTSCSGGNIFVRAGYWRGSDIVCSEIPLEQSRFSFSQTSATCPEGVELRAAIYPCLRDVCVQKNSSRPEPRTECREGHNGVACGTCLPGWALQKGTCVRCADPTEEDSDAVKRFAFFVKYIIPSLLGTLALIFWYIFAWRPVLKNTPGLDVESWCAECLLGTTAGDGQGRTFCGLGGAGDTKHVDPQESSSGVAPVFKILAGFFQVLSSFAGTFQVEWPASFLTITSSASVVQFDLMALPGIPCSTKTLSYFETMMVQTMFPPAVIAALAIPSLLVALLGLLFHGGVWHHPAANATYERFFQSLVLFLFLIYPSISRGVLESFNLVDYGAGNYHDQSSRAFITPPEHRDCSVLFYPALSRPVLTSACYSHLFFTALVGT